MFGRALPRLPAVETGMGDQIVGAAMVGRRARAVNSPVTDLPSFFHTLWFAGRRGHILALDRHDRVRKLAEQQKARWSCDKRAF